ncbi:hypothetical protein HDU87_008378 [Geranomyces variabilis]|uniref:Prolyl 4-hydroxylase alpha subunit domain-containing protein n=1 Tax=Geranomyces variabilis TaxID=109894 RepID=A0AAD5XJU3_9FUNG|nr:hypothetical protein HDU87_008378 [Geranomyces variabilis]
MHLQFMPRLLYTCHHCAVHRITKARSLHLPPPALPDLSTTTNRRLAPPQYISRSPYPIFLLRNVLTPAQCDKLVAATEHIGYVPALTNDGTGAPEAYKPHLRRSLRCIVDAPRFTDQLYRLVHSALEDDLDPPACGLNPRLRVLKYAVNDRFVRHRDGVYVAADGASESRYTMQVYLNDGYTGGRTAVWVPEARGKRPVEVEVEKGMAVVFDHRVLHEGRAVEDGVKYVVRMDVMIATGR